MFSTWSVSLAEIALRILTWPFCPPAGVNLMQSSFQLFEWSQLSSCFALPPLCSALPFVWGVSDWHFRVSWMFSRHLLGTFRVWLGSFGSLSVCAVQPALVIILLIFLEWSCANGLLLISMLGLSNCLRPRYDGRISCIFSLSRPFPTILNLSALTIRVRSRRNLWVSGKWPCFLKMNSISMSFTSSILTFNWCLSEWITLMLFDEIPSEGSVRFLPRVRLPRCDWSVRCAGVVRWKNCVILPTVRLKSNSPYIWLFTNFSSASIAFWQSALFCISDSPVYVIGCRPKYSVNVIFSPAVFCAFTSKWFSRTSQRVNLVLYCLLALLRFRNSSSACSVNKLTRFP